MAWVERLVTRTTQPQDAVGIDWNNPLTRGLVDVSSGAFPVDMLNQGGAQIVATLNGRALKGNGSSSYYFKNSAPPSLNLSGDLTLFAVAIGATGGTDRRLYAFGSSASANPILAIGCGDADATKLRCFTRDLAGAGGGFSSSAATAFEDNKSHYLTLRISATLDLFVDGKAEATQSRPAYSATTFNRTAVGCLLRTTAGSFASSALLLGLAFNRALSDAEIKSITENPWQIFETEVIRIWVDDYVSTGGAATVIPIGVQATGSVGTPSATGAARATPAGVSASSAVGTPVAVGGASIPATVLPAGVQATGAVGTVSATGAAVAQPVGVVASGTVGTPVAIAGTSIPATVLPAGVQASGAVGTPTAKGAAIAQPLGVAAIGYVGTPTIATGVSGVAVAYPAGVQAIGQVGTLIATGAAWTAAVGVQAVASVGTPAAYAGEIVIYVAGAQTRPSRLQSSSRPSRLQTGTRASR